MSYFRESYSISIAAFAYRGKVALPSGFGEETIGGGEIRWTEILG